MLGCRCIKLAVDGALSQGNGHALPATSSDGDGLLHAIGTKSTGKGEMVWETWDGLAKGAPGILEIWVRVVVG